MDNKLKIMKEGGRKLGKIRNRLLLEAKRGVRAEDLDKLAEDLILKAGGRPSFKMVGGYSWATCICINDCIVHGIPGRRVFNNGDTVTVDVGMFYKGYHTDTASSIIIGRPDDQFLKAGKAALEKAIQKARSDGKIGAVSRAMQKQVEDSGYNVARTLVGHGIGKKLHDDPQVPCFLESDIKNTPTLKRGMTLAIEVIYMEGEPFVKLGVGDKWSIFTKDGFRSAMFEHTIAVTDSVPLILTR